jgi:ornithine cyclodeaminase/alanine dehydrogenase-like protein (mu-crystallin family)
VCDDVTGSRIECGDLIAAVAAGRFDWAAAVELNAIAAGTVTVPRAGDAPVLFETQGVAIQDVAVCALAYERHVQRIGTKEANDDHVPPTLARRG